MNPGALLLAQARETLDAADRLGHSNVPTILAAIVLVLAGAVAILVREIVRQHNARLADAAARHADAERHSAERLAQAEEHAAKLREQAEAHAAERAADHARSLAEIREAHAQDVDRLERMTNAAQALNAAAEAMGDARDTFRDSTTPLSTPTPRRGR